MIEIKSQGWQSLFQVLGIEGDTWCLCRGEESYCSSAHPKVNLDPALTTFSSPPRPCKVGWCSWDLSGKEHMTQKQWEKLFIQFLWIKYFLLNRSLLIPEVHIMIWCIKCPSATSDLTLREYSGMHSSEGLTWIQETQISQSSALLKPKPFCKSCKAPPD